METKKIKTLEKSVQELKFWGTISIQDKNSKSLYSKSFGYADAANKRLNNESTRYGIASGTKLFTALATLAACNENNISIDTQASTLLGDDFYYGSKVTIRHLLSHSSGIPCYCDEDAGVDYAALWNEIPVYKMVEQKDFLKLFPKGNNEEISKFKAGEGFHYNNSAFIYLAMIIEKITGTVFQDYVKDRILKPSGISQSGFFLQGQLPENCSVGYEILENGQMKSNIFSIPPIGGGDGGMYACAEDIHKIWKAIFNETFVREGIISKELQDEMLSIQSSSGNNIHYGLGLWIYKEPAGEPVYYIVGGDPGVAFTSKYNPETGNSTVLLANTEDPLWDIVPFTDAFL